MKSLQGSPTPVTTVKELTEEKALQEVKNGINRRDSPNLPQDPREDHKGRERHSELRVNEKVPRNRRNKTDSRSSKNNEGTRMDIDDQEEVARIDQETRKREFRHKSEIRRGHRKYLEECFRKQIGLPVDSWQNTNIYSFTDHRVAKGYQKVVTTCQGMYYEIKENQVDWGSVGRKRLTIGGDFCWRGNGVTIYQPTRESTRRPIVPHRFAINLGQQYQQPKLGTDRYYIHVYQTKIGSRRETLRSKEIAREISKRWREVYLPRSIDPQKARSDNESRRERPGRAVEHNRLTKKRRKSRKTRPSPSLHTERK